MWRPPEEQRAGRRQLVWGTKARAGRLGTEGWGVSTKWHLSSRAADRDAWSISPVVASFWEAVRVYLNFEFCPQVTFGGK